MKLQVNVYQWHKAKDHKPEIPIFYFAAAHLCPNFNSILRAHADL